MLVKINFLNKNLILIFALIIILVQIKINPVFAMEQAHIIGKAISENNLPLAETLLQTIREQNLTDNQLHQINDIINTRIMETNPNSEYHVHNLNIQNPGNLPEQQENYTRNILVSLALAIGITFAVWLIFKYWSEIRDTFFEIGSRAIPLTGAALRAFTLQRFQLIRNDPQALHDIQNYLQSLTNGPYEAA